MRSSPIRKCPTSTWKYAHNLQFAVFVVRVQQYFEVFYKKLKNVSCEYNRWVVETQLRKLHDTSDTLIGRACAMFHL